MLITNFERAISILILLLSLVSCRGKEVDVPLPFEGEKLVVWGKLEVGKPVRIQVMKSFSALGELPENPVVNAAKVFLYKNSNLMATLPNLDKNGNYGSDLIIESGATYRVTVEADGMPTAESEEIEIPEAIPNMKFTIQKNTQPELNPNTPQNLVSIQFNEPIDNSFMEISFLSHFSTVSSSGAFFSARNSMTSDKDCYEFTHSFSDLYRRNFLFNGACVAANSPLRFSLMAQRSFYNPQTNEGGTQYVQRISMKLATFSKAWFTYTKVIENQPDGLDLLVLPPQKAYTNIKNGYGLVYGYISKEIQIR